MLACRSEETNHHVGPFCVEFVHPASLQASRLSRDANWQLNPGCQCQCGPAINCWLLPETAGVDSAAWPPWVHHRHKLNVILWTATQEVTRTRHHIEVNTSLEFHCISTLHYYWKNTFCTFSVFLILFGFFSCRCWRLIAVLPFFLPPHSLSWHGGSRYISGHSMDAAPNTDG